MKILDGLLLPCSPGSQVSLFSNHRRTISRNRAIGSKKVLHAIVRKISESIQQVLNKNKVKTKAKIRASQKALCKGNTARLEEGTNSRISGRGYPPDTRDRPLRENRRSVTALCTLKMFSSCTVLTKAPTLSEDKILLTILPDEKYLEHEKHLEDTILIQLSTHASINLHGHPEHRNFKARFPRS